MTFSPNIFSKLQLNRAEYCKTFIKRCQSSVAAGVTESSTNVNNVIVDDFARAKPFQDIPSPKGLPILGNMMEFMKKQNKENVLAMHQRFNKELGPIYKIKLPSMNMVCITSAEDTQTLYGNDGNNPVIPSLELFERIRKGPLKHLYPNAGLLSISGDDWYKVRSLVQQDMMRPKSALFYIDHLDELMEEFINKVEDNLDGSRRVDGLSRILSEFALDSIGVMFIGSKLGVLQGSEYGKIMIEKVEKVFNLSRIAVVIPKKIAPYVSVYKECYGLTKVQVDFQRDKINEAIKKHEKDGSLEGTILAKMIERCGPDSGIPVVMANDALFAGIDTTGNTASFLLYHLATHPEEQENLYQEILKVVGKNGKMTSDALAEMKYLKACQQESARLSPVAFGTARSAGKDMVLSGYQIPKGTFVMRVGYLMSNNGQYFSNPDQFIPERWIRGCPQQQKPKNSFAHIPFGHGPRACVGQRFAKLDLYMIVFKLIQKYKISYEGPELGIRYKGMGSLNGPLALKFEERK